MAQPGKAETLADCIATSPHLKTLVGLMHQGAVSATVSDGRSHNGVPFVAIVVQGPWVELAREIGARLVAEIEAQKAKARRN